MEDGYRECIAGFERIRRTTKEGVEYWVASELMPLLEYASWEHFRGVVERALAAARSAGAPVDNHFHCTTKLVRIGSGAEREVAEWYLTRYACYLVAMNADARKPPVAHAMTYFAGRTRQAELLEKQILEEQKRVEIRLRTIQNNKSLAGAAKKAGVIRYGLFQDAGYKGFYGGYNLSEVKAMKGIGADEELLDRIGPLELAAHDFRITVTEDRLNRDSVRTEEHAISTHRQVGSEIRAVMQHKEGKRPEDLPPAPSIKKLVSKKKKRIKDSQTEG